MDLHWVQFIRQSTKQSFEILRKQSPISCPLLSGEVLVSKKFFNHIARSKRRKEDLDEQLERQLIVPFVADIIECGVCTEVRKTSEKTDFRLEKKYGSRVLVVIVEKKSGVLRLVSCFRSYKKKELVSVSIDPSLIEEKSS